MFLVLPAVLYSTEPLQGGYNAGIYFIDFYLKITSLLFICAFLLEEQWHYVEWTRMEPSFILSHAEH